MAKEMKMRKCKTVLEAFNLSPQAFKTQFGVLTIWQPLTSPHLLSLYTRVRTLLAWDGGFYWTSGGRVISSLKPVEIKGGASKGNNSNEKTGQEALNFFFFFFF